jgi:hypothetical protein
MADCSAGDCSCECPRGGCGCIASSEDPSDCSCHCYHSRFAIVKGRKILFKTFKPRIKVTSQTKFNICTHDLAIRELAQILDKYLPNEIVVPANIATNRVTISLKNKTLRQIINGSSLALKS